MKNLRARLAPLILSLFLVFFSTTGASADTSLSVTVTPPLFQLTISPGETWSSSLKIVNANSYDVTYYAEPMDFASSGENGGGDITPVVGEASSTEKGSYSLASWIDVSRGPVTVRKGTSGSIPFTVHVPPNAEPGGHYAAIIVGTKPPHINEVGASVAVSSYVSSLLFVRIQGDVVESGRIREFHTEKSLYQTADASFLLRFENTGNTHLRPTGLITIYNMWGKERGKVFINQTPNFGNVLPRSIRKFEFLWNGEESVFDIGKYSAVVTLSYGEDGKQNVSATTYFWVVPVVPVAWTILTILLFLTIFTWGIRRYIRRALLLEGVRKETSLAVETPSKPEATLSFDVLARPLREGVIDMRRVISKKERSAPLSQNNPVRGTQVTVPQTSPHSLLTFIRAYHMFFLFVTVLVVASLGTWLYLEKVLVPTRSFEIQNVSAGEESN